MHETHPGVQVFLSPHFSFLFFNNFLHEKLQSVCSHSDKPACWSLGKLIQCVFVCIGVEYMVIHGQMGSNKDY